GRTSLLREAQKLTNPPAPLKSTLPALANVAHVKDARLRQAPALERLAQDPRRLQDLLHGEGPGAPVDAHGALAARVAEDLDRVEGVGVHGGEGGARVVGADGDEPQVERPAQLADLLEL